VSGAIAGSLIIIVLVNTSKSYDDDDDETCQIFSLVII